MTVKTNTGQTFEIPEHFEPSIDGEDLLHAATFEQYLSPREIDDGTADEIMRDLASADFEPELVRVHRLAWRVEVWAANADDVDELTDRGLIRMGGAS